MTTKCPQCGSELIGQTPESLCPQCLLRAGLSTQTATATADALPPSVRPRPGECFGAYRIGRLLGRGGMGEVYEADQIESGRRVALKILGHSLSSPTDEKRFLREGRLAASISHPNVVYVYGSEEIEGNPVIAMELVRDGTLRDRVRQRGPMPVAEAVDAILQVIDGLEAARAVGVLHRDIKPANCFISSDGTVKIGDFGLSISTLTRTDSYKTAPGSILGTPAFAAPEQLRGDEADVSSDLYAVGATLYFLLTGRAPLEADEVIQLITAVLDRVPESPQALRPEISAGLAQVVMRCLAKQRTARFASYEELRRALLPFSSLAPTPATLGLRGIASIIDSLVLQLPNYAFLYFSLWTGVLLLNPNNSKLQYLSSIVILCWTLAYYAVLEGYWGASVGKALCGLRVVGPDRLAPGLPRAMLRVSIYKLFPLLPFVVCLLYGWPIDEIEKQPLSQQLVSLGKMALAGGCSFLLWGVLFATMRRRNGFAGIHELLSGTRVIARSSAPTRPRLECGTTPVPAELPPRTAGPYHVLGPLSHPSGGGMLLGYDPVLRRKIWIHRLPGGTPAISATRRDLSRASRLRWLTGVRSETESWDAYEAPDGQPLLEAARRSHPWNAVRFWLLDLAEEIHLGLKHQSLSPLGLDRVWITSQGRALLLDFPCPGLAKSDPVTSTTPDLDEAQRFLHQVAELALGDQSEPPPLYATPFLRNLQKQTFRASEFLLGTLQSLLHKPAVVSRPRRMISLLLVPGVLLPVLILTVGINYVMETKWSWKYPDRPPLWKVLELSQTEEKHLSQSSKIFIAAHYADLAQDPAFWSRPDVTEALNSEDQQAIRQMVQTRPTPVEVQQADRVVKEALTDTKHRGTPETPAVLITIISLFTFGLGAAVSILWILCRRENPVLRALGIGVVTRDGQPASRSRLVIRTLIWSGFMLAVSTGLLVFLIAIMEHKVEISIFRQFVVVGLALAVPTVCLVWSVLHPTRGPLDRLVGTWLVPR